MANFAKGLVVLFFLILCLSFVLWFCKPIPDLIDSILGEWSSVARVGFAVSVVLFLAGGFKGGEDEGRKFRVDELYGRAAKHIRSKQ